MADDFKLPEHGTLNKLLEAMYLSTSLQDWAQTKKISRDPNRFQEKNTFLGEQPSKNKVNAYFLLRGLGHYGLSQVLPDELAVPLQIASLAESAKAVNDNRKIGLGGLNKPLLGAGALAAYFLLKNGQGKDNDGLPEGVKLYEDKDHRANFKPEMVGGAPGGRVNLYW
jgi:hypothetical protein